MDFETFVVQLADAYEHVYDLVYLRTHPLMQLFTQEQDGTLKDRAWKVHHHLLEVIQELDPGHAPITSREWRRHRLLTLRYGDGLPAQAVADQLAISRRHYYRAHDEAIQAIASILWNRYGNTEASPSAGTANRENTDKPGLDRMELLRLEAAQMSHIDQQTDIAEVLNGIFVLLKEPLQKHRLDVRQELEPRLNKVTVDSRLLRQLLLALIGYLIERIEGGTLQCRVSAADGKVLILIQTEPAIIQRVLTEGEQTERLAALEEMAVLCNVSVVPQYRETEISGFDLTLSVQKPQNTILVVDDNDDILELVERYLRFNQYEAFPVKTGQQAIDMIGTVQPSAIILDLMMPDRDGWDLLQYFLHQPLTQKIPIIVCSVLRQKELALSLGAAAFLEKPVSEQHLIELLNSLIGNGG